MDASRDRPALAMPMRVFLAALSFGSAAIHVWVIPSHFSEYWIFGVFFALVAILQVAWGFLVLSSPTRWVLLVGAVGNGFLALIWLVSRTAGLPIGPEPGIAEAVGWLDLISTVEELLIVAGVAFVLLRSEGRRPGA